MELEGSVGGANGFLDQEAVVTVVVDVEQRQDKAVNFRWHKCPCGEPLNIAIEAVKFFKRRILRQCLEKSFRALSYHGPWPEVWQATVASICEGRGLYGTAVED